MHEEFCFVSDFPEVLKVDAEKRPHCETGPSHRWRDGWSLYHLRGVRVPSDWIENKESLTPELLLSWPNVEQRRVGIEFIGWNVVLAKLNARVIDEDPDPEIGQLIEVEIDGRPERFLKVRCATARSFALPVPPDMKTALEAQAWTWGLDEKTFLKPEVRT